MKTEEELFFYDLLDETQKVFLNSSVYEIHKNENWNFAVCETPIQKEKGIIFGLNWGGDNINVQTKYPKVDKNRNWNFITHSKKYFENFLKSDISDLNYSNLCFFRSPKIHQMKSEDWALAIPLFKKYVNYINPPWTIMLGSTGINYLSDSYLSNKKKKKSKEKQKELLFILVLYLISILLHVFPIHRQEFPKLYDLKLGKE